MTPFLKRHRLFLSSVVVALLAWTAWTINVRMACRACITNNDMAGLRRMVSRQPALATAILKDAYTKQHREAFEILLQAGANPDGIRHQRLTLLHRAARNPDSFWLEQLLKHHADPNYHKVIRNIYPIMEAIEGNCPENVRLLIKFGADVHVTTYRKKSLLTFAWGQRRGEIVMILLDSGALINPPSPRYESFVQLIQIMSEDLLSQDPRQMRDEEFLKQARQRFREQDLDLKNATWDESQGDFGVWKIPSFSERPE